MRYHLGGDGDAAARLAQTPKRPEGALTSFDRSEAARISSSRLGCRTLVRRDQRCARTSFVLAGRGEGTLNWFVDGQACRTDDAGLPVWQPEQPGFYTISAVDSAGRESGCRCG